APADQMLRVTVAQRHVPHAESRRHRPKLAPQHSPRTLRPAGHQYLWQIRYREKASIRFLGWKLLAPADRSRMLVLHRLHGGHPDQHRRLVERLGPACTGWQWPRHYRYKIPSPESVVRDAFRLQDLRHRPHRQSRVLRPRPAILRQFELMIHADRKIPDNLRYPSQQLHKPRQYVPEWQHPVKPHPPRRL